MMFVGSLFWGDNIYFVSTQQRQSENTTTLQVICTHKKGDFAENPINKLFDEGNKYTLILKRDGDYMDFYVDEENNKICTLIGVDKQFIDSIVNIVRGESVDLSQITWPRRADGSTDYPPPKMQAYVPEIPEPVMTAIPDDTYEESTEPETATVEQPAGGIPPAVILAIMGGAVVLAAVAVILIKRKR